MHGKLERFSAIILLAAFHLMPGLPAGASVSRVILVEDYTATW